MTECTTLPVIGLVGGIAAGKSKVAEILRDLGCLVCDSDALGREALRDPVIKGELRRWWGEGVFDETGEVSRPAVANIVFKDAAERARLEALTHPWIESRRRALFASAPPGTKALVIDAPLLLEAGIDRECDRIIFVDSPRALRLDRVKRKRGWTEEELNRREASQLPLDEKRRRAHDVVVNDGDRNRLAQSVSTVLEKVLQTCR